MNTRRNPDISDDWRSRALNAERGLENTLRTIADFNQDDQRWREIMQSAQAALRVGIINEQPVPR